MHVSLPNEFSAPHYQRAAHGSWLQAARFRSLSSLLRRCGLFGLLLIISMSYAKAGSPIRYVKPGGTGDGFTWANASGDLQAMINATSAGGQVWVAAGTYTPTVEAYPYGKTFQMKAGVKIYGGFAGTETQLTQRPTTRPSSSTLSGSGAGIYHVVYSTGLDNTALLDGFVITGGNANVGIDFYNAVGGGMFNRSSSPSLSNISFVNNQATTVGGGMYNEGSSPSLSNVSFQGNKAGSGGGMYNTGGSPKLFNVSFVNNQASQYGGAIHGENGTQMQLVNGSFQGNSAMMGGGAISSSYGCMIRLTNCVLWNNGGDKTIRLDEDGMIELTYCLFQGTVTNDWGSDNIRTTINPFASATDVSLVSGSAAIDAGNIMAYQDAGGPSTDLAGKPRFRTVNGSEKIDMGAMQYQPVGLTLQASGPTGPACPGSAVNVSVSSSNGTAPFSYTWTAPAGVRLPASTNSPTVSATLGAGLSGVQQFTVLVSDASSPALSGSATVALTVDSSPDYLPLVDLYNATNGPNWTRKTGWLSSCDPCKGSDGQPWQGVSCLNGRVAMLLLGNNQLDGSLPASLSALTNLQILSLGGGKLRGSIPASLSTLTGLLELQLQGNQLSGSIPASLSALTKLQSLFLNNNYLSSSIPASFSTLTKLGDLYLNNNQLSGSLPASLSALTNLQSLNVAFNQLDGSLPASFSALTNLQSLVVNNNQLSGSIPASFSALTSLKNITSLNNQLSGSIPASLSALTNLENLDLSYNQLSGSIPASLSALTKLQSLNLTFNQLSGSIPAGLGTLSALATLRLRMNQLSGCLAPALKALCGKTVDISNNPGLPGGGDWAAFCSGAASGNCVITLQTSATPNPVFAGSTATLSVTPSGATAPYSYTWAAPPGITLATPNQAQTAAPIPVGTSGVLTFTITVADATPIYSISLVTLTVTAASPATQTACRSTQVVLNSGISGVRYEWYRGGKTAANKLIDVRGVQQGTTTSSLTLVSVQTNATYYCKVFGASGSFEWAGPFAITVVLNCGGRVGADEPGTALQVLVAPNPLEGSWLRASISGAEGQPLTVQLVNLAGTSLRTQQWQAAQARQPVEWDLSGGPAGVYLLQVRTPTQTQTLRIVKP